MKNIGGVIMALVLNEKQRIEILIFKGYGDKQRYYQEVWNLFNALEKQINNLPSARQ